jgi:Tol biopolymer transport system component
MGVHSGPVNAVSDVNERTNVAGAGINTAQRVMSCGDAGHILLSKRVADDLAHYGRWQAQLHDLGEVEVKHGVKIHVVNLCTKDAGNAALPEKLQREHEERNLIARREVSTRRRRLALIGAALVVITMLAIFFFPRRALRDPASTTRPTIRKEGSLTPPPKQSLISTFPGSHRAASFSPDGQKIAFINTADAVPQLWVKDLSQGQPVQITSGEDPVDRPRWSPLGDQIVYARGSQGAESIWSIPPASGTPHKVIEGGRNPNWSWDGARLVFERAYDIWTANADGSDQRKVEGVPPTDLLLADRCPAFSPNGSLIAFFQKDKGPIGDIRLIPAAGGQARRLTFDAIHGGAPAWTPDGQFIVFPSQRAGSMTLWKVPAAGGQPEPVLVSAGEDTYPEISRDGRRLIYTNTRNSYIVTVTDPTTGRTGELQESRTDLVDPSVSPQGDKILFFGFAEGGDLQLFTIGAEGGGLTQVTRGKGERNVHPQWSAEGSTIYFYQTRPSTSFRKISIRGGESSELVSGWEWGTHHGARVDSEGKRIIYSKLDKGNVVATMIRDLETGKETAFSLLLRHPRWSHDGNFIAGTDLSSGKWSLAEITLCPLDGGPCRKLTRGNTPHWSADDSRIYFFRSGNLKDGKELWSISREGADERKITDLRPMHPIVDFFDVSPTGQVVWVQYRRGKEELWLLDFPAP